MRKLFFSLLLYCIFSVNTSHAQTISGEVRQEDILKNNKSQVVDTMTQKPITGAAVSIPNTSFSTTTDDNGQFKLDANFTGKKILSVQKEGYRPFSLTIDKDMASKPIRLGIEKSKSGDITIEKDLCHLGDDVYSDTSANSSEFRTRATGAYLSKNFDISLPRQNEEAILIIGSIIGLDTKMAKEMGQNRIAHVYSSPTEVYFNGELISQLKINGDNQEILVPRGLIRQKNEITIKTGRNIFQHSYVDYDDIEVANIRLEIRQNDNFANK